ncbi:VanZ family protein [Occultella kanbiaonis]|uniref:VanZ family protein n=1 Tax=Occultella kanbiaonis TaxID=2675754 RepID=UPI001E343274|nr:VanZ family protein [Occultella kanbiaonis]
MTTTTRPALPKVLTRLAFAVAVIVQLLALYWPRVDLPGDGVPGTDKAVHVLIFATVMATGLLAGIPGRWLALGLAAHAVLSELIQHLVLPERSGDPLDLVADLAGIALGWYVITYVRRHSTARSPQSP